MTLQLAINAVPLRSPLTGIGQYIRNLTAAMDARGDIDIRYFYGTCWRRRALTSPMRVADAAKHAIKKTIPFPYVVMRMVQRPVFSAGVRAFRPHVYHEPNFVAFPFRGPTVSTVHDLSFVHYPETQPKDRLKHLEQYLPITLVRAAHIITDSEAVRREAIVHFGLDTTRVTAIHLGVDEVFAPRDEATCREVLARYGLCYGRYALSVGTLEPRKNLVAAIRAFGALPERVRCATPLVIAGKRGWLSKEIESLIHAGETAGWLRFHGFVPQADLPFVYAGARLFVFPSRYEGFGLPVVEAMASGVPVITSSVSCLPEITGDAADLVHPDDADGLRISMERLLEDETHRAELRARGIERAKCFSWQRCAKETMSVYRHVVGTEGNA
jgi:glycosyltransferase involved in cell wall biosynthesis